jgi:RNA polymerase sigma-70 factor (ECF subfamily)
MIDNKTGEIVKHKQVIFEKLVRAYSTDLFRFGFWLVKDRHVAEDLVQETFARAWKAIDSLNDEKAAKSWLFTILRRENARRFEKKRPETIDIEEAVVIDDKSNEPEIRLDKQLLYKAIMTLEDDFKEPLLLQLIWGYSGEEIGAQLDLKLATVNTRLFRARKQLKQVLLDSGSADNFYGGIA